uniref:DUF2786 domain-containing protein n=1 Tax=Haemonchus contortus TaxID=6289 RepID=A0A7I4YW39_HAECO
MDTTMLSERWRLRLENEILHRNAISRVDCLVELLIRAVEDLADSNDVKDRRQLATASFRTQKHWYAIYLFNALVREARKDQERGKGEVEGAGEDFREGLSG